MKFFPAPRAAYLHIPFCRHHCGYCNFSVIAGRDDLFAALVRALQTELSALGQPREVDSIFLGGGTPTHLPLAHLLPLIESVRHWLPLAAGGEFSIEMNPEDCTSDLLMRLRDVGVNRVSLGVQSFDDSKLQVLQRGHSGRQAIEAIDEAATILGNVSADLIFATPGETVELWRRDLQQALRLPLKHLSTYGLTIERGSAFYGQLQRREFDELDEDAQLQMYRDAIDAAKATGFEHYEVSNFAVPDFQCRHNLAYWRGDGWYAFGPGAARFVGGRRQVNHRSTTTYIRRLSAGSSPVAESETISARQWAAEKIAFGLRRRCGVDLAEIQLQTGVAVDVEYADVVERLAELGMLDRQASRIALTERGLMVSDSVVGEFLKP